MGYSIRFFQSSSEFKMHNPHLTRNVNVGPFQSSSEFKAPGYTTPFLNSIFLFQSSSEFKILIIKPHKFVPAIFQSSSEFKILATFQAMV